MRIRLRLKTEKNTVIPYNYQYYITSLIYSLINKANPSFARTLHSKQGYKFFTFSELIIKNRKVKPDGIETMDGYVDIFISSPNNEFIKSIVKGILSSTKLGIKNITFVPIELKIVETPKEIETLKTLSPIYMSTKENNKTFDLYPNNSKFFENLKKNLKNKYIEYFGREPKGDIDFEIISFVKKRIKIKDCYYRCSHMKFKVKGDKDLIKFGYECGFGSRNSLGFGCVETL